jgi:hypothetical protein
MEFELPPGKRLYLVDEGEVGRCPSCRAKIDLHGLLRELVPPHDE